MSTSSLRRKSRGGRIDVCFEKLGETHARLPCGGKVWEEVSIMSSFGMMIQGFGLWVEGFGLKFCGLQC